MPNQRRNDSTLVGLWEEKLIIARLMENLIQPVRKPNRVLYWEIAQDFSISPSLMRAYASKNPIYRIRYNAFLLATNKLKASGQRETHENIGRGTINALIALIEGTRTQANLARRQESLEPLEFPPLTGFRDRFDRREPRKPKPIADHSQG